MTKLNKDARFSAYALGEVEEPERLEFERMLAESPEDRRRVGELAAFAELLEQTLRSDQATTLIAGHAQTAAANNAGDAPASITACALEPAVSTREAHSARRARTRKLWLVAAGLLMLGGAVGLLKQAGPGDDGAATADPSTTRQFGVLPVTPHQSATVWPIVNSEPVSTATWHCLPSNRSGRSR